MRALLLATLVTLPAMAIAPQGPAPVFTLDSMGANPSARRPERPGLMIKFWRPGRTLSKGNAAADSSTHDKPMGSRCCGVNVDRFPTLAAAFSRKHPVPFDTVRQRQ